MQKENYEFVPPIDFKEQTPEMLLKEEKVNPIYEKAYLSGEGKSKSEFARNTTAWD